MNYPFYVVAKYSADPDSLFQRTAGAPECGILHRQLPQHFGNTPVDLLAVADVGDRIIKVRGEADACFICEVTHAIVRRASIRQLSAV